MSEGVMGEDAESTICAYDISDPDNTDEDDDLLDSYQELIPRQKEKYLGTTLPG